MEPDAARLPVKRIARFIIALVLCQPLLVTAGVQTLEVDAWGQVTHWTSNVFGYLRTEKQANGDTNRLGTTRNVYDAAGYIRQTQLYAPGANLSATNLHPSAPEKAPTPRVQEVFHFDPAGNIQEQAQPYQAAPGLVITGNAYEEAAQWRQSVIQRYNTKAQAAINAVVPTSALLSNRIEVYQDHRYAYDAYGRLIKKVSGSAQNQKTLELKWDDNHQLVQSTLIHTKGDKASITTAHYAYDALGRRLVKTTEGATETGEVGKREAWARSTQFVWSENQLLGECQSTGTGTGIDSGIKAQTATYVYDHPASFVPIARLDNLHEAKASEGETASSITNTAANDDHWPTGVNVYHLQTDQIGTPRELTSHSGGIAWQAEYRTWGNTLTCEWLEVQETSPEAQRIEQNLRFQGQYFDQETGLHYNRFRYYDPDVGRFVCQDPIGLMGGNNIYAYAINPIGWIDPFGLKKHCGKVYRGLNPGQEADAKAGRAIAPKNSSNVHTPQEHVANGRLNTQFISTTKSLPTAMFYAKSNGSTIIQIDLDKIDDSKIVDISCGNGLTGKAKKWAKKDSEVLIRGSIPVGAYKIIM